MNGFPSLRYTGILEVRFRMRRVRTATLILAAATAMPTDAVAQQQGRVLAGSLRVWDASVPFAGAAIRVLETNAFVCADQFGRFEVPMPEGEARLRITPVGFAPYEVILAAGAADVELPIGEHVVLLDGVDVTGYSLLARGTGAGSVATLTARDLDKVPASTVESTLQGKIAGAEIQSNSGAPGGGFSIGFRGIKTILGDANPVFVVDGAVISNAAIGSGSGLITGAANSENAVNRIADINPADIESIQVLRGPSATAQYGSRAGNGVVIINTKRGHPPEHTEEGDALFCFMPAR